MFIRNGHIFSGSHSSINSHRICCCAFSDKFETKKNCRKPRRKSQESRELGVAGAVFQLRSRLRDDLASLWPSRVRAVLPKPQRLRSEFRCSPTEIRRSPGPLATVGQARRCTYNPPTIATTRIARPLGPLFLPSSVHRRTPAAAAAALTEAGTGPAAAPFAPVPPPTAVPVAPVRIIHLIYTYTPYTSVYRPYRSIHAIPAHTGYTNVYRQIQVIQAYTCYTSKYGIYMLIQTIHANTSIYKLYKTILANTGLYKHIQAAPRSFRIFSSFPRRRLLRDGCQELSSTAPSMLLRGC